MVTEVTHIKAAAGKGALLIEAFINVEPVLRQAPGLIRDKLMRVIERPDEFYLEIEWETLERHLEFTRSQSFATVDGALQAHIESAEVVHCETKDK
jgi:heme-degrading monooxygenase HmoA